MPTIIALLFIWLVLFCIAPVFIFVVTIIGLAVAIIVWDSNRDK
jgi:hypothetical protein